MVFASGHSEYEEAFTFHYVVPHEGSPVDSGLPLQLFLPGTLQTSFAFWSIAGLPRDAIELTRSHEELVGHRIIGRGYSAVPVQLDALRALLELLRNSLVVVWSCTEDIDQAVDTCLSEVDSVVLRVKPGGPLPTRSTLVEYCLKWADANADHHGRAPASKMLLELFDSWSDPLEPRANDLIDRQHNLTAANFAVLRCAGHKVTSDASTPLIGVDNEPYFKALQESVECVDRMRQAVINEHPFVNTLAHTELILTAPAILKSLRGTEPPHVENDRASLAHAQSMLRQMYARPSYSFLMAVEDDSPSAMFDDPYVQALIHLHADDMRAYTAALALRASANFVPVLRLPMHVNGIDNELSRLAGAARHSGGRNPHKVNRLAKQLSNKLAEGLPPWVSERIANAQHIKIISDAPLEWMPIDGIPLMLRADVSRITVTPGNLFFGETVQGKQILAPEKAFEEILILRSFRRDDPLHDALWNAIALWEEMSPESMPQLRLVDVQTKDEMVSALNSYSGAVMVFDGHGQHGKDDIGSLVLAEERVSAWSLRGNARVPPAVILSACDTHPFAASHATTANGFLAAGATSVWATAIPVEGHSAALLVARMLFRINRLIPMLLNRPWGSFRWSEILPGLQRRQFVTESLRRLRAFGLLRSTEEKQLEIETAIGMLIEQRQDWFAYLLQGVAELAGRDVDWARVALSKHAYFVEALAYMQFGNPELLVGYRVTERSKEDLEKSA